MGERKTAIQAHRDRVEAGTLSDSADMEEGVVYVGLGWLRFEVRMEWLDGEGDVQTRQEPYEGCMCPIKATLARMYEEHLRGSNMCWARVEDIIGRYGKIFRKWGQKRMPSGFINWRRTKYA